MAAAAFEATVWLRYQTYGLPQDLFFLWEGTALFAAVCAVTFWWNGLYRGIWHYASLTDLWAIARAVTFGILAFLPLMFALTRLDAFPRSGVFILWPVLFVALGGPRLLYRLIKDGNLNAVFERGGEQRVPVLLAGAGDHAETFIRDMARPRSSYRVVGIVDDKPGRVGRDLRGVRVWGTLGEIPVVVARLTKRGRRPQRIVVTSERFDQATLSNLIDVARDLGMTVARLPRLTDFAEDSAGRVAFHGGSAKIRPVAVEDLLGRPQRVLDRVAMRALIAGRTILVTGAGGTIGSELARQIAALEPSRLVLLEQNEYALYMIDLEIQESFPALARASLLADVRDPDRIAEVFASERPAVVFHAAAYKHVPLSEANPEETVLTNVGGTKVIADTCVRAGVAAMVLVSTDKAVAPASVMGATKRAAERYCLAASEGAATRFVTVRFGNVLGSTGSVVPLFHRQIAAGGPVTVTHPEATRYFMTTREAVELILQASADAAAESGGAAKVYVLDMGEPIRIVDLARQMIRLAGLRPDSDVAISFTGLRPGEKLHEQLFGSDEPVAKTMRDGILLAAATAPDPAVRGAVARLIESARSRDRVRTLAHLSETVAEYRANGAREGASSERSPRHGNQL
jgi:O-antigen biosynthesis protein WbqV